MLLSRVITFILATACIVNNHLNGQVVLSEYSASNLNQYIDNYFGYEDWIELHNPSDIDVDISAYGISDKINKPQKWTFPQGTIVKANSYLLIWCSGKDLVYGHEYHTNFKLSQTKTGEFVVLSDPSGNILESAALELTLLGHSRSKNIDGQWAVNASPSPAYADTRALFTSYTNAPTIDQTAGYHAENIMVSINSNEPNSTLRYTLDGNFPTKDAPEYQGPISVSETTVVKARSFSNDENILPGKIDFKTFLIGETSTLPMISIAADELKDLANGDRELRPIGSIEYFIDGQLTSKSYGELNSHGQDSWINPQRSLDWVSRDEMGYSRHLKEKLFDYSDRVEYQRFMLRASGDDNYPSIGDEDHEGSCHIRDEYSHVLAQEGGMKLDLRAVSRVVVFLNGEYWGIYSPRERPVDHDYTDYTYKQDKNELQYLLTWGRTWAEYGGKQAFDDWEVFRDFIMNNDMGNADNYQKVKNQMQVISLMDYMILNLNTVCSDWINYNTGWWRGTNPDGSHKKWGYILWDNDATFDYYINYSGVPDISPNAAPCDIDDIALFMEEEFFDGDNPGEGFGGIDSTFSEFCTTIQDGTSPYESNDIYYLQTINENLSCCFDDWDAECQELYFTFSTAPKPEDCAVILNGTTPHSIEDSLLLEVLAFDSSCCGQWDAQCDSIYADALKGAYLGDIEEYARFDNFGLHEQIFLKLQEESTDFRELYYARQADMINTAFSCENMLRTLDRMTADIAPEMPRHIERWGNSVSEWEENITSLRTFVERRCARLEDGILDCYDVTGPYQLTLDIYPPDTGDIDLNTIEIKSFPWTGSYFGNMANKIDADPNSAYDFLRWETKNGTIISPDLMTENVDLNLTANDTITAVFILEGTSTKDKVRDLVDLNVYPSPNRGEFHVEYQLERSSQIELSITNLLGEIIISYEPKLALSGTTYDEKIDLRAQNLPSGTYFVKMNTEFGAANSKVCIVK